MPKPDGSIRIDTKIESGNVTSQMLKVINAIKKDAAELDLLNAKMDELAGRKIPTQEYQKVSEYIQGIENHMANLITLQKSLESKGLQGSDVYKNASYLIKEMRAALETANVDLKKLVDTGRDFTLGKDTEQFAEMSARAGELSDRIEVNSLRLREMYAKQKPVSEEFSKMADSAKKTFHEISKGTKTSSGLFSTFVSRMKGMALSLLIFNWISKGFNAMISGMKKGFENFAGYSGSYVNSIQSMKNAMATLGNQIAAAFSPIIQMAVPWINQLISALSTAISYVAQFIAVLGGSSTFTRAKKVQDAYNKSLNNTASAAKKAFGALASFDTLEVLNKQDAGSGAGAGAGASDMFEKVPVEKGKEISALLDNPASILRKMKEAAKGAITALSKLWDEGLSLFAGFICDTLLDFYNHFLVPVGKWVLGKGLPRLFEITNNLLKSINWSTLLKRLRDFYDVLAKMAKFTFEAMLDFYEDFLAPIAAWTMNKALPALLKTLTDLGNKIKWDTLNSALRSMFEVLSKFALGIGDGLILFWEGIEPIMTTTLAGCINAVAEGLRFLADILDMIPEEILAALGGALAGFLSVFITYEAVSGIMGKLTGAWNSLYKSLQTGIAFLASNPYMAIAAGISAIVGALIALDEKAAERSQIEQYGQTLDALCSSINNRSEAIKNQSDSIKNYVNDAGMAEMMLAENLADKYYELSSKESLTNSQKEEMRALSERLVELLPELSAGLDKETGMISKQKDEVYGLIEAKREQYRLEAAKESIVEAYRNQLDAEQQLKEATDLTSQAQEKYNEEVRKYNEAMEEYNKHAYDFAEAPSFGYVVEARENWKDLAAELETAAEAFDGAQESIEFLEGVMESGGKDCTDGFIEGYDSDKMIQTVRDSAQSCIDAFRETNDSHSPSKVYEGLAKDTIDGYVVGIERNKSSAISVIQELCTEIKDAFVTAFVGTETFSGIFTGIKEQTVLFMEFWADSFKCWWELNNELYFGYDIWYEQFNNMLLAYQDINSIFMAEWQSNMNTWWTTMVMPFFETAKWMMFGTQMKTGIMTGFKVIVNEIGGVLNNIIKMFDAAFKQLQESMNDLINDYNKSAMILGTSTLSHVHYKPMGGIKIPALADGAVLRGGNPFMAILNDQPRGQVNVETPASVIRDMVTEGIQSGLKGQKVYTGMPAQINMYMDSEKVAEVTLDSFLSEMNRRGYDLDPLGWN